jgi:hypothetical protein
MLAELQLLIADRLEQLRTEEGFEEFPILVEAKGDIDSQVAARLQTAGAGLVIATPGFRVTADDRLEVDVSIVVTENVIQNRSQAGSGHPALELGELLIALLHKWAPTDETWTPLQFDSWELKGPDEDGLILVYLATLKTSTVLQLNTSIPS